MLFTLSSFLVSKLDLMKFFRVLQDFYSLLQHRTTSYIWMHSIRYHLFCSDQYFCLNDLEATWQQVCKHSCSFKNIVRGWLRFKQQFAVLCVAFIFLLQTTQKLFIFLADMYTRFKTWSSTSKNPSVHSNDWKVEKNWRFSWLIQFC